MRNLRVYSEQLLQRNAKAAAKSPMLGIFWIHPDTKELVSPYVEPLENGRTDPELQITDAGVTHSSLWNAVRRYHPEFEGKGHDEVPRGRVFYDHGSQKFYVWGPESYLSNPVVQRQVLSNFNLNKSKTVFESNRDYEL